MVHAHNDFGTEGLEVRDVCVKVAQTGLQSFHVGLADFGQGARRRATSELSEAGDENGGGRPQARSWRHLMS